MAPELEARPEGIIKINGSVWELQKPEGPPEVDVIFFHGIQFSQTDLEEADWKTWVSRDRTKVWPKDWLGERFPNARIWSISYNAIAVRESASNEMRLKQISENLLQDLVCWRDGAGKSCPVILVGHSLGGIILKRLLIECKRENSLRSSDRITEFLDNCKGVFYYSTPFGGSRLGDYLNVLSFKNEPVVKLLTVFSSKTAVINNDFHKFERGTTIQSYLILEGKKTRCMGVTEQVVEEGSARSNVDTLYTAMEADHIDVCKPLNPDTDGTYTKLEEFIQYTVMEGQLTVKELDEYTLLI